MGNTQDCDLVADHRSGPNKSGALPALAEHY